MDQINMAEGQRGISTHDIILMEVPRGRRVWLVTACLHATTQAEDLFQIRPLDLETGSNVNGEKHEALVPMHMIYTLKELGKIEVIHRSF